jgi:L-iditol 2-dehydrogenase
MSASGVAAVLRDWEQPLELIEYPTPQPEPGALLVAVEVATVCGSDVHNWQGKYQGVQPLELPLILGHEAAGRIVAVGPGAERDSLGQGLATGDRVIWTHASCGSCWACTVQSEPTLCSNRTIGMLTTSARPPHFNGTFAEYSYVRPTAGRVRIPDAVPSGWASAASCALRTAIAAVERAGRIDPIETIVIQGAGTLGLFLTAILSRQDPRALIVIGAPDDRLALAREWGASATISIDEHRDPAERRERVLELTGGRGADIAFEAAGVGDAVSEGVDLMAANGRYVIVGSVTGKAQSILAHRIVNRGLTLIGSYGGDTGAYYKALDFMQRNRSHFDWERLLGRPFGLGEATDALLALQAGEDIKPQIVPGTGGRPG